MTLILTTETNPGVASWASGGSGGSVEYNVLTFSYSASQDLSVYPPVYNSPIQVASLGGKNTFLFASLDQDAYLELPPAGPTWVGKTFNFRSLATGGFWSVVISVTGGENLYDMLGTPVPSITVSVSDVLLVYGCENRTPPSGGPTTYAWNIIRGPYFGKK